MLFKQGSMACFCFRFVLILKLIVQNYQVSVIVVGWLNEDKKVT